MPRPPGRGHDVSTPMTVPPGATLADTRRQLVLRAFASTNGDYARTATIVGMSASDVRSEIASLLNGNTASDVAAGGGLDCMQRARPAAGGPGAPPQAGEGSVPTE